MGVDVEVSAIELQSSSGNSFAEDNRKTSETPICNALRSKLFYMLIVVICLLITVICFCLTLIYEKESNVTHSVHAWREELSLEKSVWFDAGMDELKAALNVRLNTRRAKNVVLFVGDGMGINTMTAARIYKHGEQGRLAWETFPHMGLLKVCNRPRWNPIWLNILCVCLLCVSRRTATINWCPIQHRLLQLYSAVSGRKCDE